MPLRIEDYALIGDCQTAALVGRDGSIDWLCWPRFDSRACLAALLGHADHGRWRIAPRDGNARVQRRYRDDTLVLDTEFETDTGSVRVTDFMPLRDNGASHVVRIVQGLKGRVDMHLELVLRFDYGITVPWVTRLPDNKGMRAVAGSDLVTLRSPVPLKGRDLKTHAEFGVAQGERLAFVLSYCASHRLEPERLDVFDALIETESYWRAWISKSTCAGPWEGLVKRSLITLKALTYAPTGGIVAAPTTSLPEFVGGVRNWDYRFCWLRDATLVLLSLMSAGFYDEACAWRGWLLRAVAGSPGQAQIMYGVRGERLLTEIEIGWLPGYEKSRPVRVGNRASEQLQLDVYGEVLAALYQAHKGGINHDREAWSVQTLLVRHVEQVWREPDEGIWEIRGAPRQFTYSKMMAWLAVDAAVKSIEQFGMPGPLDRWRALRQEIHDEVCRNHFDHERNTFVQYAGSRELDASLLRMSIVGFMPHDDPRMIGTVAAIGRELLHDGYILRYQTGSAVDGLPRGEGAFLACSFWYADNLLLQGRVDEARSIFERLVALCNDVGLLAEEYDPHARRFLGNFPQAFSHVALIGTGLALSGHGKREAPPLGEHARGPSHV